MDVFIRYTPEGADDNGREIWPEVSGLPSATQRPSGENACTDDDGERPSKDREEDVTAKRGAATVTRSTAVGSR